MCSRNFAETSLNAMLYYSFLRLGTIFVFILCLTYELVELRNVCGLGHVADYYDLSCELIRKIQGSNDRKFLS